MRAGPPERAGPTHRATGVARRLKLLLLPVATPVHQRDTGPRKEQFSWSNAVHGAAAASVETVAIRPVAYISAHQIYQDIRDQERAI